MSGATPRRGDEDEPHDPHHSACQIEGLIELLGDSPRRVLELGCGGGRVLVPLAAAGHEVIGVDRSGEALALCGQRLADASATAQLVQSDFLGATELFKGTFDAITCLGNTFMEVHDVDQAVTLLQRAAERLAPGGAFVIDDIPGDLWPQVTEGYWLAGVGEGEEGDEQIAWAPCDAVFALRRAGDVDPEEPAPMPGERQFRLWTDGALRLAARCAGLSAPQRVETAQLIVLRRSR